jgi:hypothetical protein
MQHSRQCSLMLRIHMAGSAVASETLTARAACLLRARLGLRMKMAVLRCWRTVLSLRPIEEELHKSESQVVSQSQDDTDLSIFLQQRPLCCKG